jgi:hypothetical protein
MTEKGMRILSMWLHPVSGALVKKVILSEAKNL